MDVTEDTMRVWKERLIAEDPYFRDLVTVDEAGLKGELKFTAQAAVASLHFLRKLSTDLGKPMEEITAEEIIKGFQGSQKSSN